MSVFRQGTMVPPASGHQHGVREFLAAISISLMRVTPSMLQQPIDGVSTTAAIDTPWS